VNVQIAIVDIHLFGHHRLELKVVELRLERLGPARDLGGRGRVVLGVDQLGQFERIGRLGSQLLPRLDLALELLQLFQMNLRFVGRVPKVRLPGHGFNFGQLFGAAVEVKDTLGRVRFFPESLAIVRSIRSCCSLPADLKYKEE
jgi:hypothetical protein